MNTRYEPSEIAGVGRIAAPFFDDLRGGFTKVFGSAALEGAGITFDVRETYWSRSRSGVIRGLHFQNPPAAVAKVVFATQGRIRDVVLDLRYGSPTYASVAEFELTERSGAVVIPRGCAHGFEVLEGPAITCSLQDGPFKPTAYTSVRWDTPGNVWQTNEPVVSVRGGKLARFDAFVCRFDPKGAARVG